MRRRFAFLGVLTMFEKKGGGPSWVKASVFEAKLRAQPERRERCERLDDSAGFRDSFQENKWWTQQEKSRTAFAIF